MRHLHVAIVDATLPYPPDSGHAIRSLNLASRLARRHRVVYLARAVGDPDRDREACARLREDHGITARLVQDPIAPRRGPAFACRLAANLFQQQPFSVSSLASRRLREAVAALARSEPIELWQAEGSPLMAALDAAHPRPRILVAHNVETLIWRRYRETETDPLRRAYIAAQCHKYERFEKRAFRAADRVIAVSEADAHLVRREFAPREVDVVDNGVDRSHFEHIDRRPDPGRLLFLGSLDWRPNLDAVRLLLDHIFPRVRRLRPDARLDLVGRRPPPWLVARVEADPTIGLHADVPDVRPFLARAVLMVVPLRVGGGSRLKILEALASGLPVVSTPVGAEGLELEPGRDYLVAEDPDAIADRILLCLAKPCELESLAASSRKRVLERYDWDRLAERVEAIWHEAAVTPNRPAALVSTSEDGQW